MDNETLIDLIAIGLPNYVSDKIDRETVKETQELYNEISKLEHLVKKNDNEKKGKVFPINKFKKVEEKLPCQICENANKGKRFHSESVCWFKDRDDKNKKIELLKSVNNSKLEVELNQENQKN